MCNRSLFYNKYFCPSKPFNNSSIKCNSSPNKYGSIKKLKKPYFNKSQHHLSKLLHPHFDLHSRRPHLLYTDSYTTQRSMGRMKR